RGRVRPHHPARISPRQPPGPTPARHRLPAPGPRAARPGPAPPPPRRGDGRAGLWAVDLPAHPGRRGGGVNAHPPPSIGSLCTGYGGLDLAVLPVLGGHLAFVADNDPAATRLLSARIPGVPNLGDIRTVNWSTVDTVDVLTAGFPCQDISH